MTSFTWKEVDHHNHNHINPAISNILIQHQPRNHYQPQYHFPSQNIILNQGGLYFAAGGNKLISNSHRNDQFF
jgi:hypothetical protein